jgi:hypothetical protein
MSHLLLFVLLFSRDTIITGLVPHPPANLRANLGSNLRSVSPKPAPPLITLRVLDSSTTPLKNIILEWSLATNGSITRKGKTPIPTLTPNHPALIRLPVRLPDDTAGESFLQLRYYSANPAPMRAPSPTTTRAPSPAPSPTTFLAEQLLQLKPYLPTLTIPPAGEITLSDENDIFTIHSPTIRISFNRQTGWLVHYEIKGIDLLDDTLGLKSNFWWPGYNDSAWTRAAESTHHPADSTTIYTMTIDSGWRAATRDPHLQLFSNTTSADQIIIRTEYTLPATAFLLHLSYTINANGEMLVTQQVEPDTTQLPSHPWPMPCFGMQWILGPGYDSITAYGPLDSTTPIDTTPLNTAPSTRIGIFHDHPTTPSPSDLKPRASSTHTNIRWWTITDKYGNGLEFIADTPLLDESALHSFDSDLTTSPDHPTSRPQIQISIDRPAYTIVDRPAYTITNRPTPTMPLTQPEWPILLPMGNLRYTYKVKPLIASNHL